MGLLVPCIYQIWEVFHTFLEAICGKNWNSLLPAAYHVTHILALGSLLQRWSGQLNKTQRLLQLSHQAPPFNTTKEGGRHSSRWHNLHTVKQNCTSPGRSVTCRIMSNASKEITARELAGFTTGKLTTPANHLLQCDFCLDEVKNKAQVWKGSESECDDNTGTIPTTSRPTKNPSKHIQADSTWTDTCAKK